VKLERESRSKGLRVFSYYTKPSCKEVTTSNPNNDDDASSYKKNT